jgi:PIN domain nuclease of toxin-antitoxin system
MKLLLDTHIWIWTVDRPEKLGREVRRQINNPKNELYLSPLSIWEACHAERLRRLRTPHGFSAWLDKALVRSILREAPLSFAVAAQAAAIELPQSDLGDVFLAATAKVHDLTLVTADEQLLACSWLKTLANR